MDVTCHSAALLRAYRCLARSGQAGQAEGQTDPGGLRALGVGGGVPTQLSSRAALNHIIFWFLGSKSMTYFLFFLAQGT